MRLISHESGLLRYRWMIIHLILLSAVVVAGWFVTVYLGDKARQEIIGGNESALSIRSTHLTDELKKIEGAVKAMAGSPWIVSALISRKNHDIVQANSALDRYNTALDASVSYLIDSTGVTVASSNRNDPDSFVGKSYQFRPYFTQAMNGNPGRYFALGITSLKRGFYASFPVRDGKDRIVGVVAMKRDLDEMERQLSSYPYCFVVNQHGIIFLSSKPDLLMKSLWPINQAIERELLTSKQFGEKPFDPVMPKEVIDKTEVTLQGTSYLASRKVIDPEGWSIILMTPTDSITIYKSVGVIVTLVVCLLIIIPLAVTYQTVRSAEAVRSSEERFQQVAQSSQDWIWQTDREGRYIYSSQAVKQILGYEPEEIIGKHYYDFFIPEEREEHRHELKGFFDKDEAFFRIVSRRLHRDGYQIYIEATGLPLINAEGKTVGYRGTNRDITERIRAEEKLRESEQRLYKVIQGSAIPTFVIGKDHRIIYWNTALEKLSSIIAEEVVGTTQHWRAFYKEERPCMADLLVDESLETIPHWYSEKYKKSKLVADAYEGLDYFPDMVGGGKWLRFTSVGIRESQGNVVGAIETLEDVTEGKKAEEEKEKLERGLLHAQKMEAIGTLAGGIAHDINNLLMGIQGYASLILLDSDVGDPYYKKLKSIEEQVKSGSDLTGQLLGFARGGRYEIRPTDLNEVVRKTSTMFGRTRKEIAIHQKYQEDLWPVEVDRGQIEQVLLNLYVNAWQAMAGGGELYLETANIVLDENYAKASSVAPGKYVKISVTDTGTGMDEKTRARIFEPFFTTKEMGRGTGLGLATVYGIIKGHKGIINVYSEKGQGTTFNLYLPASEKEVIRERKVSDTFLTGKETVLIIDDEEMILAVTREMLESLGYKVHTAGRGREAINAYSAKQEEIDLVILDMIMPEMGGGETFDHLKEINPDIKVILSSGYALNGQANKIMERGCRAFIQKPFTVMSLSQRVREVLDISVK
ncbi:MAG: PAS domain S-box protein [Deltaproteobacteria bacterium]|nr:PAS domain S-box protein [Deltaproteobacteria bacterium]